jgi:DNA-binding NarL/FixJ family response regulator
VLELVASGLSNKQIAEELRISAHTVKFHVNAILAKLDVHSRTEAVVRAMQLGVVLV